jgi:hypothetical protein
MVDLPALKASGQAALQAGQDHRTKVKSLLALADQLWMQRGSALATETSAWSAPASLLPLIQRATPLLQQVQADDSALQHLREEPHAGVSGLVGRASGWSKGKQIGSDRDRSARDLDPILAQIGRQAPDVTFPKADLLGAQAVAAGAEAGEHDSKARQADQVVSSTNDEIKRRTDSEKEMGFDALYTNAYLKTVGLPSVPSPVMLKKGESAVLSVAATLARQRTRRSWVGGSSGFSFPIGHTGIRYRVGSFRGHPVEQQFLANIDSGTLVVTNQRLAYVGSAKSTSMPLEKLLHVEGYQDGLAIFKEGRENPDFYYVAQPKYVLFMINWLLDRAAPAS